MRVSPVQSVLAKLAKVRPQGSGWMACCPAHEDRQQSLSVASGKDGRVLLKCHAGCHVESIVQAVGLTTADLFPSDTRTYSQRQPLPYEPPVRPVLVATYDYTTADGTLLFQSCRYKKPDGSKAFKQRRPDGNGNWINDLKGVEPVLYRWPAVQAAMESGRPIYVVEGEKDADTLAEMGYAATTNPMGAGKWREAFSQVLAGAEIVILPDNDDTGRDHAEQVAASLTNAKCTVRVVELPGLPPKGDVSDWLAIESNTLETLESLIGQTRVWTPDPSLKVLWTLREVLANDTLMRPPTAIVPRFAWEARSTLLASAEKAGKSTLAGYMAATVSKGGMMFDQPCATGRVLIVGLEEFIGDCARRLQMFDAHPDAITLVSRMPGDPHERPQLVRSWVEHVKPVLVIVDSLMAYSAGVIDDASKSAQMQPVVQGLTDLAHELGVAVVLIHHARKQDGKYRDSSAIGGAVDVIAEVFIPDEANDPTRRRANVRGRIPQCLPFDFRYYGDTYALAMSDEAPIELRIAEHVRSRPGCSANDVAEALGSRKLTLAAITRMVAGGHLRDTSSGHGRKLFLPDATLPFGTGRPVGPSFYERERDEEPERG